MSKSISKKSKPSYKSKVYTLIFAIFIFAIMFSKLDTKVMDINIGDTSPREIRATKDVEDKYATEELRNEIKKNNNKIYIQNPSVQTNMKSSINNFIYNVKKQGEADIDQDLKIEYIKREEDLKLSEEDYKIALSMTDRELDDLKLLIDDIIGQVMPRGVVKEDLDKEKENIKEIINLSSYSDKIKTLSISLINGTIEPNKEYDEKASKLKLEEDLSAIEPVIVKENQVVLRKGEVVTEDSMRILKELGLLEEKGLNSVKIALGILLCIGILGSFLSLYINEFNKGIYKDNKYSLSLLLVGLTILLSVLLNNISSYLLPISMCAMLISLLVDIRLGIILNTLISLVMVYVLKLDIPILFMYLISGYIGSILMKKTSQRQDIILVAIKISIINMFSVVSFSLIRSTELKQVFLNAGFGLLNGILCGVLVIGTLPLWENMFNLLTPLRLMELSNPNQPLLKKLLVEAPGTYHHSVMVGNLSERGAELLGADGLLARTASYYHDIGKLKRPYFFKENQIGIENPHDELSFDVSAKIILNHTLDGVEMAKKNRLPKEIIDIIEQHHGDTKVMYFYYKAKEENPDVLLEDFMYKGPKPQTIESAIVMMADSCEAAVRSIQKPTEESIEDMVKKVIKGKYEDGQFDECDINFKDIKTIEEGFISTFLGIFHDRIEYPDINDLK